MLRVEPQRRSHAYTLDASHLHGKRVTGICLPRKQARSWSKTLFKPRNNPKRRFVQNMLTVASDYRELCSRMSIRQNSGTCYMAAATNTVGRLVRSRTNMLTDFLKCYRDASLLDDFSCSGDVKRGFFACDCKTGLSVGAVRVGKMRDTCRIDDV